MLVLLSPAKNLDFASPCPESAGTRPVFAKEAGALAEVARCLSAAQLARLMGVSQKLAELNRERFAAFKASGKVEGARPAAFAFNGDVYRGFDARTLGQNDLAYAQDRLRILSGLYGLLRPLDAIQPYRLEMGLRFKTPRGATLYDFWGARIAEEVDKTLRGHADGAVVNLASEEYFLAVDRAALRAPTIAATFREEKDGKLRTLQFFAKRARGLMARWIVRERVERRSALTGFDAEGYRWSRELSSDETLVFVRPQPPLKGAKSAEGD